MKVFPKFKRKYKEVLEPEKVSSATIGKYKNILPDRLIRLWETDGLAGYCNGLIWTIDPTPFKKYIKQWVHKEFGGLGIPFMRTAFADLIIWHNKPFGDTITLINTRYQETRILGTDLETLFELKFCDEEYLPYILKAEKFLKIQKKLGTIGAEECYAYNPVLASGGKDIIENLKIVNFTEHLNLLTKALKKPLDSPE